MICTNCKGAKQLLGMGCMTHDCSQCNGTGKSYDKSSKNYAKQNILENSEDFARETNVDQGSSDYVQSKRKHKRKRNTVGISDENIQKREESGQSCEKIRCDEDKEVKSSGEVQSIIKEIAKKIDNDIMQCLTTGMDQTAIGSSSLPTETCPHNIAIGDKTIDPEWITLQPQTAPSVLPNGLKIVENGDTNVISLPINK